MESQSLESTPERLTSSIVGHLLARGFKTEAPAVLRGKSGTDHTVSLSATANWYTNILFETYVSSEAIGDAEVVSTFIKALDTSPSQVYVVCVPGASDYARRLARFYGVKLVEGSTVDEALTRLVSQLPTLGSLHESPAAQPAQLNPSEPGVLKCYKCGYSWRTRSRARYVTCPSCHFKVNQERVKEIATVPAQGKQVVVDAGVAPSSS